jgi:hypothetical protein
MKEIQERMSTYFDRIERLETYFENRDIIISTNLEQKEILVDGDDDRIQKEPILWRLNQYNLFYIVTVPGGTDVSRHSHDEAVFRFLASGDLLLNNEYQIQPGSWFVIRAGVEYEIKTKEGYTTLAGYVSNCRTRRMDTGLHGVKGT